MNWFDELAKTIGKGVSRREAFRLIAGGLAAACGLGATAGRASAQRALINACRRSCRLYGAEGATQACVDACVACSSSGTTILCQGPEGLYCCPDLLSTGVCPEVVDETVCSEPF